jgi:hypothetical protein
LDPTNAYVLVQTDQHAHGIARRLRTVNGVVFAEDVRGPYDALALARPDGDGQTLEGIVERIRTFPGVIRALAAPVAGLATAPARSTDAA